MVLRPLPSTLKFKLSSLVVLLALGATLIVTLISLMLAERDMKVVIGKQQFALLSSAASHLDDTLVHKKTLLRTLAESVPPAIESQPDVLHAFLIARPATGKQFAALEIYGRDGSLLETLPGAKPEAPLNIADQLYFQRTITQRNGVISAPFLSKVSGKPTILITAPVFDANGRVVLVLAGSIDLLHFDLFEAFSAFKQGGTGFNFIMTTQGILISHPTQSRILQHINARPGHNAATQMALDGFEGWTEAKNKDGAPGIYSYKRLRSADWIVGARFPSAEAFAPLREMRYEAIAAAALFAVLAGLLAWRGIEKLLRPLEYLRRSIADILAGRASIDVLQLSERDEIGELSGAFYKLTAEREVAQANTRDSEIMIRNILERAPDAFVSCDSEGTITEWNAMAEATFGWLRDEVIGKNIANVIIPLRMREDHNTGMRAFARTGTGPIINNRVRVPALCRDGREIQVELSVGVLRHGDAYMANAFLHDISARITYEEQIANSEKRARIIADSLPVLIAYLDRDLRYQFTNIQYQKQWKIDPKWMIGKTLDEVFPEPTKNWRHDFDQALAGQRVRYERESTRAGHTEHFMVDLIPDLDDRGKVAGVYLMAMDITERKNSELKQAASEQRAEAASRAKSEFVANMSHEIRTPMNAVLGLTHLLGHTELNSVQKNYLDMILASGNALLGILNDVLDFSKIEAGRMELSPEPFTLTDVLKAVATVMTLNPGSGRIELAIGVEPGVPQMLIGDAMRLQQVLVNLVSNAIKFTEQGEVSLLVEQISRHGDTSTLRFLVRDTGIGIDTEQQSRLFSAFTQADASTTRRFGGTGLGLAISRRLVDLMGGNLEIRSKVGVGSDFILTLPLHASAADLSLPDASVQPPRILVVDDNATSRSYLCKTLRSLHWLADSAANGDEALKLARRAAETGRQYEAVLCDWQMPGMDGLLTMQALRRIAPEQPLPLPVVVMVGAHEREQLMGEAGAAEANAVLIKPVTASSLYDTLHQALHLRNGEPLPEADEAPPERPLAGLSILLVEDHPLNQVVARGLLEFAGARIELAENGQLAVDLLAGRAADFHVVLMDVQMPVMDGFEATRVIRGQLGLRLPILAMSAGVMQSEQEKCRAAGMDGFIAKPIDAGAMLEQLAQYLPPDDSGKQI